MRKGCEYKIGVLFLLAVNLVFTSTRGAENSGRGSVNPPTPYGAVPSERQLRWHELEVLGMVNFSTITYYGKEWGYGDEDPAKFNPVEFDAGQIARAARSAGIKLLVIDAKHHGGFCLWPSKYNDTYTVKNSPWRDGKGDMVKELSDACRGEGIKVGIYLSPWDRNHKDYGKPEYVSYYHNQLDELLTNYGVVDEMWFDGANGGDGWYGGAKERRTIGADYYQWEKVMDIVRKAQPTAACFGREDIRWVGNEAGFASDPCWATVQRNGTIWYPAEADFPLRHGWFWHPGAGTRSAPSLVNNYFVTVGRNSAMDIGIAPDRRGLIDEPDIAALKGFGDRIQAIFKTNLAREAKATASNVRGNAGEYEAANVLKGMSKFKTYWATDDGVKDAELVLDFGKSTEFSVISLREPIQLGHRIDDWALDSWQDGQWKEFSTGSCIGARRLWRGQPITSVKVRLRLINASASPAISEFGVYLEPEESRKESGGLAAVFEKGLANKGWKVASCSAEGEGSGLAACAIDGKAGTFWHTHTAAGKKAPPQFLAVDMGFGHELTGFLYLPRQDHCAVGNVTRYTFATSGDGQTWAETAQGEFGNIAANPVQQKIVFGKPAKARYFKFTATGAIDGCVNAAEIGVIGK